jgi:hypothetical protein
MGTFRSGRMKPSANCRENGVNYEHEASLSRWRALSGKDQNFFQIADSKIKT